MIKIPLVVGSVAYDYIFKVANHIRHELPLTQGQLPDNLQLAFSADDAVILRGGTGGNIAYGLSLLNDNPMFVSAAGKDFDRYKNELEAIGCHVAVVIFEDKYTAHCYQVNDPNNEQIIIWQSNAYKYADKVDLQETLERYEFEYPYAIFSPGSPSSTPKHIQQIKKMFPNTTIIFDPGQMTMAYDSKYFSETIQNSDILIVNDAELSKIKVNHKLSKHKLFDLGLKWIIETCAEQGSKFHNPNETDHIGVLRPQKIVDPTGAGDAYRAGLIHGLMQDFDFKTAGKYGAIMSSFCLETLGAQTYNPTLKEIEKHIREIPEIT